MYIISYDCTLENIEVEQVVIYLPKEAASVFKGSDFIRYHYYKLKYKGKNLDIACPVYRLSEQRDVVIIPWYLILGRPYPLQVYQFACSYYINNPDVGQRGAAEATRLKFDLKTFSHTTVGRSFKSFEESHEAILEKRFGEEVKISGADGLTIIKATPKAADAGTSDIKGNLRSGIDTTRNSKRRFPSTADTSERRKMLAAFLPKFCKDAKTIDIEAVGCRFVEDWHKKTRRLLL